MIAWQVARHQVAIAGRVSDAETGKLIRGAEVTITAMPAVFQKKLEGASRQFGAGWAKMLERPDKTQCRADGLFYFLDLPDGKYSVSVTLSGSGKRYGKAQQAATVSRDAKGNMKLATLNFTLPPTALKGKITAHGQKSGVLMAEVRIKGSGERAFSDAQGQYMLAGIEPGKRTVLVFAQGFRTVSQPVTLAEPGTSQTVNFSLVRETG